eukprot:m.248257 g.248257  ORF g.248257 m.248257 type:complete len:73 (-) comp26667_c0_seq3:1605-1823(-)
MTIKIKNRFQQHARTHSQFSVELFLFNLRLILNFGVFAVCFFSPALLNLSTQFSLFILLFSFRCPSAPTHHS